MPVTGTCEATVNPFRTEGHTEDPYGTYLLPTVTVSVGHMKVPHRKGP